MKKRHLITFSLVLFVSFTIEAQNNYTLRYSYRSNEKDGDVAEVSGCSISEKADVIIPEYVSHDGFKYKVVGIGNYAFDEDDEKNHYLQSISLPQTIETIGTCAFRECYGLSFLELPENIKSIGSSAFELCSIITTAFIHCSGEFYNDSFKLCKSLSTIIYTNPRAPKNWVATTRTYVPDKEEYSSPKSNLTSTPHIIEMITFSEHTFEYNGSVPNVTWTNNIEGYTATLDMKVLSADAGSHVDTIAAIFTNGEHTFSAKIPYRYTIKPAVLAAKVNDVSREYGEDNPNFNVSFSGFVGEENESVFTTMPTASTIATKTSNAGDYPISISGGSATNYELIYESGTLTITKAPLSAKVKDAAKVYGMQNPAFSLEYDGLKNGETAPAWTTTPIFQTEATTSSNVGQYAVTAKDGVPVNYDLKEIKAGTLNVTPASLTITANDATRQYYSDNPTFSFRSEGFVNNEDENVLSAVPTLSTSATKTSDVGDYQIEVSGTSSKNYNISFVSGTLSVTPRTLIASVGNYERAYNEDNPAFEVTYDGFVGNDNESVLSAKAIASTSATKKTDVGAYPIVVSGGLAINYDFSYNSGTLTIHKTEQTLSWEQELTGLKVGDQVELKATASSELPITYTLDDDAAVEIYTTGTKYYLDCKADGQTQILATQDGNRNYYSAARIRKMIVVGEGDAIHAIEASDMIIQGTPFGIRITNAEMGETIGVYSLNGVLLKSLKVEEKTTDILLPLDNVYLIKVGGKMVKLKL